MRALGLALALLGVGPARADEAATPFWNRAASTVTSLRLSHAGTGEYGDNVAGGGVTRDQKLPIADLPTGFYDMELKFKGGRACFVRDLKISSGKTFYVEEASLRACAKR